MKRAPSLAVLAALLAAPAAAQQLLAWPINAPSLMRVFLPGEPLPTPRPLPGPRPTPFPNLPAPERDSAPVRMTDFRVEGVVTDRAAELTYRIVYHNPTNSRLEGVLLVPIPAETTLSGFAMTIDGKETKGELLESGKAASIYEGIVRREKDPGLLELVGERLFRARVFPIAPGGSVTASLKLTQTLPESSGLVSLRVPMGAARFMAGGAGKASARIALKTTSPLRTLFAPNPDVRIERRGENEATISYESGAAGPQDLAAMFSLRRDPFAAGVLSYREEGEDGTFLLTLSPRVNDDAAATPKDVVFVLDRSGSMADDGKIDLAKRALSYCVSRLSPQDRFGIVDFATDSNEIEEHLLAANDANKARAKRYIAGLEAAGGTNIEGALSEGLKLLGHSDGRVPMIFFVTDGVPTEGRTDINELLREIAQKNNGVRARLFSFGVGSDVNTLLLDKLADEGRGARDYVAPGEDIEAKVSSLYQKVAKPALTDVKLEWRGLEVTDAYPRPVPDLFRGSELALYGRYKAGGKGTLVVTGKSGGRGVRFEYPVELPEHDARSSFLPRLWASQKVAHELDALRLSSGEPDPEAVASIVKLAKKYGIVTPYTSFLVTAEGEDLKAAEDLGRRRFSALSAAASASGFGGAVAATRGAQLDSLAMQAMSGKYVRARKARKGIGGPADDQSAEVAAAPAAAQALSDFEDKTRADLAREGRAAVATRTIGDKTFYHRGEAWIDADAESAAVGTPRRTVTARSDEYFALAAKSPELARCLALGERVEVFWAGTIYAIAPNAD